ncbi:MAG: TIGR02757 family protein [Candidatus Melainabacteria bacterium GWF2_32_7]|nr:MAG: TIGR02757 family protein [Candidatus Melainabacteria bacterium GWF2_32_7]
MNNNEKKKFLDSLVRKYEIPEFIDNDPIKFPHMFDNFQDQEISGLISSALAYGKRDKILESVEKILKIMDFEPYNFVTNFDFDKDNKLFNGFIHRYTSGRDIALLISALNGVLKEYSRIKNSFLAGFSISDTNIKPALTNFVYTIRGYLPTEEEAKGFYFLIPSPEKGSACKRLNMFLRWMVRPGPVDLNLWQEIPTDRLIIPLDVHVARLSRKLDLTSRKVDDWKTAEEITENLKEFDKKDPAKYDFAIFGMGISGESTKYLL